MASFIRFAAVRSFGFGFCVCHLWQSRFLGALWFVTSNRHSERPGEISIAMDLVKKKAGLSTQLAVFFGGRSQSSFMPFTIKAREWENGIPELEKKSFFGGHLKIRIYWGWFSHSCWSFFVPSSAPLNFGAFIDCDTFSDHLRGCGDNMIYSCVQIKYKYTSLYIIRLNVQNNKDITHNILIVKELNFIVTPQVNLVSIWSSRSFFNTFINLWEWEISVYKSLESTYLHSAFRVRQFWHRDQSDEILE